MLGNEEREVTEYIQVYQNGGTQIITMYPGLEKEMWKETGQWGDGRGI